jgi:O-antigen ligase
MLLLTFLSGLVFRIRAIDAFRETTIDAWAMYRIGLMTIVVLVLAVGLVTRRTAWTGWLFRGVVGFMAIYAVTCAVSTIWSVFPTWTLYKSLEYFIDVALIAAVVSSVGSADEYSSFVDWVWVMYGLLLCSVWAGAALAPALAFLPNRGIFGFELQGVMPQLSTNGVGEIAALLGVVSFSRLILRPHADGNASWYSLLLIVSVSTLILAQTRSATIGFLFGVFLAALYRNARVAMLGLAACVVVALLSQAATQVVQTYMMRGQDAELFNSLSGRMTWWQTAWPKIQEKPWLGYGAYAGGRFVVLSQLGDLSTSSIHNSYIEVVLGTGLIGLAPLLAALAGTWKQLMSMRFIPLYSNLEQQLSVEALSVLGVVTARSLFSVTMIWHPALDYFVILGYAELLRRRAAALRIAREPGRGVQLSSWSPLRSNVR